MEKEFTLDELDQMEDKEYSLEELENLELTPGSEKMGTPFDYLKKLAGEISETEGYKAIAPYVEPVGSVVGSVAGYVGDVINYLDAPMREAAMAPKRISEGYVGEALYEPFAQFAQSGSDAPTWKDVAESYGVPKEIEMEAPLSVEEIVKKARGEEFPQRTMAIPASEDIGMISELALGGKGLGASIRAAKPIAKGITKIAGKGLDLVAGSTLPSEALKQAGSAVTTGAQELKQAAKEFADPTIVNRASSFGNTEKNIVQDIFGNDIPSAIKYTPDSEIVRMEKVLADKAGGGQLVKKHNEAVKKVVDYIADIPNKIAAKSTTGSPLPKREAGSFLLDRYNAKVKDIFKNIDVSRNSIVKMMTDEDFNVPGLSSETARNIKREASKIKNEIKGLKVGENNPVALEIKEIQAIIDDVDAMVTIPKGKTFVPGSIKDLHNKLTSIGRLAFEPGSPFHPIDKARLKKLYNSLNKEFISDVRLQLGDEIADGLIANNKTMSNFFAASKPIDDVLSDLSGKQLPPEEAFKAIIEKGDSNELRAIQELLSEGDYKTLKASYINDKIQKNMKFIDENSDIPPAVNWSKLENELSRENAFDFLFDKSEQDQIKAALGIGRRMGTPYASKSGTGLSVGAQNLKDRVFGMTQLQRQKDVMEGASQPIRGEAVGGVPRMLLQKQNVLQNISPLEEGRKLLNEAIMQGIPPFVIEEQVKKMDKLKPSEKTILRQEAAKAAK